MDLFGEDVSSEDDDDEVYHIVCFILNYTTVHSHTSVQH